MIWIPCSVVVVLFFWACHRTDSSKPTGIIKESAILEAFVLTKDTLNFFTLAEVVDELNCISSKEIGLKLVFSDHYDATDSTQILVVPFRSLLGDLSSCAYSNLKDRYILLNPSLVKDFNQKNTINDTTSFSAVLSLILLHELGHFALGKEGAFDRIESRGNGLGQQKMNTEPEYMTIYKRTELEADSLGASWVKKHLANIKDIECFGVATNVQMVLPGMQFQIFGTRILENFGSNMPNLLRDPSNTHPNLELRIAFMNYYLTGLPDQKKIIDNYLYEREVAPIHRQETDPRIFQGMEKMLTEDTVYR